VGPVVVVLSSLALVVAGLSWMVPRTIPRAFATYCLGNTIICVILDHTVGAEVWIDPFSFLDVFAFAAALLVGVDRTRRWALVLALALGLQVALHLARAADLIPEHGVYRPGLNVGFTLGEFAILWGVFVAPSRPRGYSV
jgi:hypothetical protein